MCILKGCTLSVMQATRAIIHLDNLRKNIRRAREKIGSHPKICVPVKADAYGHGAVHVSRCALEAGAEYLAVAFVSEAMELRAAGIAAPILILSQAQPDELTQIISNDLSPFVSDADFIEEAGQAAQTAKKKLCLHLKVDTGMRRLGCPPEEAPSLAAKITSHKWLHLEGMATHLSVSDSTDPGDVRFTKGQIARFMELASALEKAGLKPAILHAANSGALVFHEDSYFDMIRPGIFLYGYSPSLNAPLNKEGKNDWLSAEPVMELRSLVSLIKKIKKGDAVSYGRTWVAREDTYIGVIPAGYADGFPRSLGNDHSVLIRGRAYPLAGRICMDNSMVNLGPETEVERWDEAVIFGPGFLNAADIAGKLNTIPYEITCGISKRVQRVYVG